MDFDDTRKVPNRVNSLGNTSHNIPVRAIFKKGSWVKYASSRLASEALGVSRTAISNAVTGRSQSAGGYRWERIGG